MSFENVSASSLFSKLWMFKPSIRLAYNMRTPRASPKNAAIHAAKVLYKLFGPSEDPIDLNRCALGR